MRMGDTDNAYYFRTEISKLSDVRLNSIHVSIDSVHVERSKVSKRDLWSNLPHNLTVSQFCQNPFETKNFLHKFVLFKTNYNNATNYNQSMQLTL
jgi:hypothetical protein